MNTRYSRKGRTTVAALAFTAGLALTVAGCGGEGDDNPDAKASATRTEQGPDATASADGTPSDTGDQELATVKDGDVAVVVKSAKSERGGFLTLSGEVQNNGGDFWDAATWMSDESELRRYGPSLSGATLVDNSGKKRYLVLRDTQGKCLCTKFEGGGVEGGETASWYAQFPSPPEGTNQVTFQVGGLPPTSIAISGGE